LLWWLVSGISLIAVLAVLTVGVLILTSRREDGHVAASIPATLQAPELQESTLDFTADSVANTSPESNNPPPTAPASVDTDESTSPIQNQRRVDPPSIDERSSDPPIAEDQPTEDSSKGDAASRSIDTVTSEPPARAVLPLEDSDRSLLRLASVKYYHNRELVVPDLPTDHLDFLLAEAGKSETGGAPLLARTTLIEHALLIRARELSREQKAILAEAWFRLTVDAVMEGVQLKKIPRFFEMRQRGIWDMINALGDEQRAREIDKTWLTIFVQQAALAKSLAVADEFVDYMADANLSDAGILRVEPLNYDAVGVPTERGKAWMPGKFVCITHQGTAPLTDVLVCTRLDTDGPTHTLNEGQQNALDLNRLLGSSDKVPHIEALLVAQNVLETVPKGYFVFVSRLEPGETLHVPVGKAAPESILGGSLSLRCEQGVLPEARLEFPSERSPAGADTESSTVKEGTSRLAKEREWRRRQAEFAKAARAKNAARAKEARKIPK
jgi:hypothetical protein